MDHDKMVIAAHLKLASMRNDQRMQIFRLARAIRDAKKDRRKRLKALADMDQALGYYEAIHVLTAEDRHNIKYALIRGI